MADQLIVREDQKNIALLRVNRPERGNAMTLEMLQDFVAQLKDIDGDATKKALVITGTGKTFLSGLDVGKVTSQVSAMAPHEWRRFRDLTYSQYSTIHGMSKPTIAAINGACVAGGMPIALSCDIRLAATSAIFRIGYRRVGLMPSASICFQLPHLIGLGRAKMLAWTDRTIGSVEARDIGMVEEVVPDDALLGQAMELAREMAAGAALMIAVTKEAMNQAYGLNNDQLRRQVDYMQFMLGRTQDHAEAISAVAEKRKPRFKGK